MITRTKLEELQRLLDAAMVEHEGEFLFDREDEEWSGAVGILLTMSSSHPREEFRGVQKWVASDIETKFAELFVAAANALPDLIEASKETVKREEGIW